MKKTKLNNKGKKVKHNTKILLLCHGNKHSFTHGCPFPISRKMMKHIVTLDLRESTEPDIVEDFTKETQVLPNSIDLVCGIYYPCKLLVTPRGKLRKNHFLSNISKVLKVGGYYVLTSLPYFGILSFSKFLQSSGGQTFLWKSGRTRHLMQEVSNTIQKSSFLNIENINHITSETREQLNYLFCLYIEQNNPNLKLITTTNEYNAFKTVFLDKFVENNKLDVHDIDNFMEHTKPSNIFVKI